MKVLLIIPAYNEELNIANVVENIKSNYPKFDYVVVNDGSKDSTAYICKKNGYNLIDLPVNLGLSGAFQTGIKYAYEKNFDCAVQFDADGQHDAKYIDAMVNEIKNGNDIVIASRFVDKKKPFTLRMFGSALISFAIKLTTGKKINDPTAGMRMFNRKIIKDYAFSVNYSPEPDTIAYLIRKGAKIKEIQAEMKERVAGKSYLDFPTFTMYMLKMGISILLVQFFRKK